MKKHLIVYCLLVFTSTSIKTIAQGNAIPLVNQTPIINIEVEREAIRKVIASETEAYYRQDFKAWKDHFVQADYFRQYGYWEGYPEKVRHYNGFDTLQKVKYRQFVQNRTYWKGSYEKRHNENFRVYEDVAWYTFEQDSFDGATHKFLGRSVELRIMEKHNGNWKIAYLGYHYLPKEDQK